MKKILMVVAAFLGLSLTVHAAPNPAAAEALVEQQATVLLNEVNSKPELYRTNRAALNKLIDNEILPYLDFQIMSRIVLGRYWNQATPAQQSAFVDAFRGMLIRLYSDSWKQYDTNATFKILGNSGVDKYNRTDVRMQINPRGKKPAIVVFSLREQGGNWKIYDASFENVSILLSYRNSFASDIERIGIDGLIAKVRGMDSHD